jgi:hypothetical protein
MKNTYIALGITILTGLNQHCSAYTWNVINLTGQTATITIKLAGCKGDGISQQVPPSDLKHPSGKAFTPTKGYQQVCCIAGVQVNGHDIPFKALTDEQFEKLETVTLPAGWLGGAAVGVPAIISGLAVLTGATAGAATGVAGVEIATTFVAPPVAIAGALVLAGAGAAFGITEAIDRCKSRDLVVGTDGAYLVIESAQEVAHEAVSETHQFFGKIGEKAQSLFHK